MQSIAVDEILIPLRIHTYEYQIWLKLASLTNPTSLSNLPNLLTS